MAAAGGDLTKSTLAAAGGPFVGFFRLRRKLPSIDWLCRVDHVEEIELKIKKPKSKASLTTVGFAGSSLAVPCIKRY
jgi:hypothetical protein